MDESKFGPDSAGNLPEQEKKLKAYEVMSMLHYLPDDTGAAEYADKVLEEIKVGESFTYDIGGADDPDDLLEVKRIDDQYYVMIHVPKGVLR